MFYKLFVYQTYVLLLLLFVAGLSDASLRDAIRHVDMETGAWRLRAGDPCMAQARCVTLNYFFMPSQQPLSCSTRIYFLSPDVNCFIIYFVFPSFRTCFTTYPISYLLIIYQEFTKFSVYNIETISIVDKYLLNSLLHTLFRFCGTGSKNIAFVR